MINIILFIPIFIILFLTLKKPVYATDPLEDKLIKAEKRKKETTGTAKEVQNLQAEPDVERVKLSWDLDDDGVDFIEIWGKYCNDGEFWRYDGFHRMTRAVELRLDPLAAVELKVKLKFADGTFSEGVSLETVALHKNVVFDEYKGRSLNIYLPDGYHEEDRKFPVVYMHDGQNLFSPRLAFVEDWRVDEVMDRIVAQKKIEKTVVVGIYNSQKRGEEYTPFADRRFGGGKARDFSDFIVKEIIPYIEKKYKVSSKREDRAVMGSSFGGILSLWMGYTYPHIFSMVGAISPSLWIADGKMLLELQERDKKDIKIWIDQGTGEFSDFTRNAVSILIDKGYKYGEELIYYEVKGGKHNEVDWSERVECPFIFYKGKKAKKADWMKIDVEHVKQFSIGPLRTVINPIAHFDNGMWYSLFNSATYGLGEKNEAEIDETGILEFNNSRFAHVIVKYQELEETLVIKNPEPELETRLIKVTVDEFVQEEEEYGEEVLETEKEEVFQLPAESIDELDKRYDQVLEKYKKKKEREKPVKVNAIKLTKTEMKLKTTKKKK
ncbi:MAG: alpha/beta hydrolase [Vulcanimicrobiota bacterium]